MTLFQTREPLDRFARIETTIEQLREDLGPWCAMTKVYAPPWLVECHKGIETLEIAVKLLKED